MDYLFNISIDVDNHLIQKWNWIFLQRLQTKKTLEITCVPLLILIDQSNACISKYTN